MAKARAEYDEMGGDDQATEDLIESFEEIDRMLCEDSAETDSLPVEWIPIVEEIATAPEAPAEFHDIAAKVESGELTWEEWYDDPGAHEGGIDLLNEMHGALGSDIKIPDLTPCGTSTPTHRGRRSR